MVTDIAPWIYFNLFILFMLVLDIKVFHRTAHTVAVKEALGWSAFWIALALAFNLGLYYIYGKEAALSFLTGYIIEKTLSIDNLFVFLMIFSYFRTPSHLQHNVLFWGIVGAIVMRALFIAAGITLIHHFAWILYLFAVFLIYAGIKMALKSEQEEIDPQHNPVLQLIKKILPVTEDYVGHHFFVKRASHLWATPLFIVLVAIETTDVIFALDSIPAILAITTDSFIVYTSNIFAILGLRALFFAIAGLMQLFDYLHYALAAILIFVGVKIFVAEWIVIPIALTLGFTAGTLLLAFLAQSFKR
jgi:tellurite resistance protein TerC